MPTRTASPITPTAHYTAAVWARNGLSHPALSTSAGRLMFDSMRLPMAATRALGGTALEEILLARHRLIDRLLESAIAGGEVSQVIEVAAGLSPRGWRFVERHGDRITYVESDLPEMVELKRRALRQIAPLAPGHRVVALDALSEEGPSSLDAVSLAELDPERGTALITEGLLTYLEREEILGLWRRTARALSRFPRGLMLSDMYLASENGGWTTAIGATLISLFVRRRIGMRFADEPDVLGALEEAGFAEASLHRAPELPGDAGGRAVRVIEALA
jgi:O-methyltransferase involved in polyketide biosynthesis